MPIRTAIWKVSARPEPLPESPLAKEQLLEEMILASPGMLSDEWMLVGRQEDTGYGGRIDLLAVAPDGSLVLIELKRDRTPRDVVAQALDYAGWVAQLRAEEIVAIYGRFARGRNLAEDFRQRFQQDLDEETLNQSHQIVIVAGSLDDSTERIVDYLNEREISINVLCFQVFSNGTEQLLTRTWMVDPVRIQTSAASSVAGPSEPWNGEFYSSFGNGPDRCWADAQKFGFISGGGGPWFSRTLQLLNPGDRVWVNIPSVGYVGVGRATGRVQPAKDFKVSTPQGDVPALEALRGGSYHRECAEDAERCEYFVPIQWQQTVPLESAVKEIGFFGNQNTVCKPTALKWRTTVDRLKERFQGYSR